MTEIIEEQESTQLDFERYLDVVRRRHIYFLLPVFLGWLLVWGISWVLPTRYKSSTLILVEAADDAGELCGSQRERESAGPPAKHHAADPQPHAAAHDHRQAQSLLQTRRAEDAGRQGRCDAQGDQR